MADGFCVEFEQSFRSYLGKDDIAGDAELIFVNDGSTNDSLDCLRVCASRHKFVKLIDLSRNFGQHIALTAGYHHASGQYVGMMNVDMEDPPSEIPKLLEAIRGGKIDIVTSLRTTREASILERMTSTFFHWLINWLTGSENPVNCSTLRVMNRRFVDVYNALNEKERYLPGLEHWIGFRHGYVPISQTKREKGRSSYTFLKRLRFAIRTILSFSSLPLKLTVLIGFTISFFGFLLVGWLIVSRIFFIHYQPGYPSTLALIVFFGGSQIAVTGVVGLYVGKILLEVQNRPLYVIRERVNI